VEDGMAAYSLMLHAGWVRAQMVDWRRRDGTSLEIDVSTPKLMSKPIDQPETDDNKLTRFPLLMDGREGLNSRV